MTPECVLHVPGRFAHVLLPIHPCLTHEFFEDEAVDVSAAVATDVDDEPLAVEDRVELPVPLGDVAAAHGPQMDVAHTPVAFSFYNLAARIFPVVVPQIRFVARGHDDQIARLAGADRPVSTRTDC